MEGSDASNSLVATSFTQEGDPGSGISCTLMPVLANHPILVASANGAAAELMVRAHHPTRRFVCARAWTDHSSAAPNAATTITRVFMRLPPSKGFRPADQR